MLDSANRLRRIDVDPYDVPLEKIGISQAQLYEHDAPGDLRRVHAVQLPDPATRS